MKTKGTQNVPKKQIEAASSSKELQESTEDVHAEQNIVAVRVMAIKLKRVGPMPMS